MGATGAWIISFGEMSIPANLARRSGRGADAACNGTQIAPLVHAQERPK